jgi:hypothetical protein
MVEREMINENDKDNQQYTYIKPYFYKLIREKKNKKKPFLFPDNID